MARAVDLDPGGYQGTYKLIGGALALDFANLVSYRGTSREHDWLDPPGNLRRWAHAANIHASTGADVAQLREVRELLARVFLTLSGGGTPAADDVHTVGALAADTWARQRLHFAAGSPAAAWIDPSPSVLGHVAVDAASLLTSGDALRRVAACRACRWLFVDTTRNRSRRWCDPADCGNRARQRRHYHRRHGN